MKNKQYKIVIIPKIGTLIDDNAFGGHYVDKNYQERKIKETKDDWKKCINCPKSIVNEMVMNEGENYIENQLPVYLKYNTIDNPYYGWKEDQLKIIIEKRNIFDYWNSFKHCVYILKHC